jgi:hypothetical protein
MFHGYRFDVEDSFVCGNRGVARWVLTWQAAEGGTGSARWIDVYEFRDGEIAADSLLTRLSTRPWPRTCQPGDLGDNSHVVIDRAFSPVVRGVADVGASPV